MFCSMCFFKWNKHLLQISSMTLQMFIFCDFCVTKALHLLLKLLNFVAFKFLCQLQIFLSHPCISLWNLNSCIWVDSWFQHFSLISCSYDPHYVLEYFTNMFFEICLPIGCVLVNYNTSQSLTNLPELESF